MDHSETLHRRNRLLVNIIWGMLLLGIVVNFVTGAETESNIILAVVGFITCGGATLMTYRRWFESYIKYYIPVIITILTMLLIITAPVITTYFLVFVNLAIMTLYSNFKPLLFSGVLGIGVTLFLTFSSYREVMFGNNHPITIMLYLLMIAAPLLASAKFSERLQAAATRERENAIAEKNRTLAIVDQVSASLQELNNFNAELRENVNSTRAISREVTVAFTEVTTSIEMQTGSISGIDESMRVVENAVSTLADRSAEMRNLANNAVHLTKTSSEEAESLSQMMNEVQAAIERSAALMKELNEQNKHIRDIVDAIHQISAQTNLLALNAAIEAARAGEHGKGFAVVSHEIRKLAETSRQATEQISEILEGIRVKTDQAAEQVIKGQQSTSESRDAAARVSGAMRVLSSDMLKVEEQVSQVAGAADDVHRQYTKIAEEMSTIAQATEQNMLAIQQMAANMSTQDERINDIQAGFLQLDKLAADLTRTAKV
jgi:methyl-accepting chemotaxis protein